MISSCKAYTHSCFSRLCFVLASSSLLVCAVMFSWAFHFGDRLYQERYRSCLGEFTQLGVMSNNDNNVEHPIRWWWIGKAQSRPLTWIQTRTCDTGFGQKWKLTNLHGPIEAYHNIKSSCRSYEALMFWSVMCLALKEYPIHQAQFNSLHLKVSWSRNIVMLYDYKNC